MNLKKIVVISLLLTILTIGAVSAEENISQNITGDEDIQNYTFENVQNIIDQAESNSTVILNGTYEGLGNEIVIDKDITIDGLGTATLDANHKSRIFNISSGSVILKNINFINAKSPTNGGAITSDGQLTVINCSFTDNCVDDGCEYNLLMYEFGHTGIGGAINANKDLTIINSSFINNSAHVQTYYRDMDAQVRSDEGEGGAINCLGDLYIEKSNFTNNSAHSIKAYDTHIENCNFENQTDTFISSGNCNVSLINSNFNSCGGIQSYYVSINLYITNCNFTNGKSKLIDIFESGNVTITDSLFSNNQVDSYDTSLIEIDGYSDISNSSFINNSAANNAVLKLESYDLKDCTFTNNRDATIFTEDIMLDDSLNCIYLYKTSVRNKLAKVYYGSNKSVMVDVINKKTNKRGDAWGLKVYINGKRKYYFDSNPMYDIYGGSLKFSVSNWRVGTYKVVVKPDNSYTQSTAFTISILKAPTIVKAPKVTNKYKKSKYFTVTVKHKTTKKAVKNTWIKLKIGKKTYKIKTNSKGIAKFNTKKLRVGKYNVAISSGNSNYKISAKSQIKIKR